MDQKVEAEIGRRIRSLKQEVAFLRAEQRMREQMDQAWKDFFEKNPDIKEQNVRQWVEERLRIKQNH